MGYRVVISAFAGLSAATTEWQGIKVLPAAFNGDPFGAAILAEHARQEQADLVITLCDVWALDPHRLRGLPVAHWMPVDCTPLSLRDEQCLRESGAVPIAMSRFGEAMLKAAGFSPLYVPHGIDLNAFKPTLNRDVAREQLGIKLGEFVIGMNAANKDAFRKGMAEQFSAFALLHEKHPDTVMLLHCLMAEKDSLDLRTLETRLGLQGAVRYVDQYALLTGQVTQEHLVNWYSALDLYSACSLGEGFCLPLVEALACGVPAVATNASTGPELLANGGGWTVPGEMFWNPTHGAWWSKPIIGAIRDVYEEAYARGGGYLEAKEAARAAAEPYAVETVAREYWEPALKALEDRYCKPVSLTGPRERQPGEPEISVCFASRSRPESLRAAVESLLSTAAEPGLVEILVAVDPDDLETQRARYPAQVRVIVSPERYGYQQLHRYLNVLAAKIARGRWVQWWNDDMIMTTVGWDKVIRASRPAVLWPKANHVHHANIAPAWPKAWSDAMGRVSPTMHLDTYLQRLGEALGRHDRIPVEIVHDRADVTGNHDDQTYAEGRKLLGPEGMVPGPFPHGQVAEDAAKIRRLLAETDA